MTHLVALKKHAKQVLRWHREGVCTVAERIRDGLPKYAGLADQQILACGFSLAEAQELIARERGFETWAALKASGGAAPVPSPAADAQPLRLGPAEPTLFVANFERTIRFFEGKLGFRTIFTYGQPAFYGAVVRDEARLAIRQVGTPVFVGDTRERQDLRCASISVENLKALYAEYRASGVPFYQELKRHPWQAQDFVVADPDGNLIAFGFNPDPPA